MNIGIFSGSFDPIHVGHMIIAEHICEFAGMDEIWFSVSPRNPLKSAEGLSDIKHRVAMLKMAIGNDTRMKYCDVETKLPVPSYTADMLDVLKAEYPQHSFSLIIGGDNWNIFDKWYRHEYIVENFGLLVFPRPGCKTNTIPENGKVTFCDAPEMEISSTYIRKYAGMGRRLNYCVPPGVMDYIIDNGLYR